MECAGAVDGCGWSGVAAEQAAHEAACPKAAAVRLRESSEFLRLMPAPLHAQSQQLQAEPQSQELQAGLAALKKALRRAANRHTPLVRAPQRHEPLVSALEGDAEEGDVEADGWRQRQRVGPAPAHDDAEEGDAEAGGCWRQRQRVGPAPHDDAEEGDAEAGGWRQREAAAARGGRAATRRAAERGEEVDQVGVVAVVAALIVIFLFCVCQLN